MRLLYSPRYDVLLEPIDQIFSALAACSQLKEEILLLVNMTIDFPSVENQKNLHRGMTYPFITIDERMVVNEGVGERSSLLDGRRVQQLPAETRMRLTHGRVQCSRIPQAVATA